MNDWKSAFDKKTLAEGYEYFAKGKAKKLVSTAEGYAASVRGSRNYHVTIDVYENTVRGMACTCGACDPQKGCRHAAAVLYLIERDTGNGPAAGEAAGRGAKDGGRNSQRSGGKDPGFSECFPEMARMRDDEGREIKADQALAVTAVSTGTPQYFRYEKFRKGLKIPAETMKEAEKLIREKRIGRPRFTIGYAQDGSTETMAMAEASWSEKRNVPMECSAVFGRTRVESWHCDDWRCGNYYRSIRSQPLCQHVTALILLTEEYMQKENPGDTTNIWGTKLLNNLLHKRAAESVSDDGIMKHGRLTLQPVAEIDREHYVSLSFRVGEDKLYKVRQINDFMQAVKKRGKMSFGKNTTLFLSPESFSGENEEWLHFIENFLAEDEERKDRRNRSSRYGYYLETEKKLGGSIPLYGSLLDQFYDHIEGKQTEFAVFDEAAEKKKKMILMPKDGEIRLNMELLPETDEETGLFTGVRLAGTVPDLIDGSEASYFVEGDSFYRVTKTFTRKAAPLFSSAVNGLIDIRIGMKHIAEFMNRTLPMIREMAEVSVTDMEKIMAYVPPAPVFICYLDVQEEMVICRADVWYGDRLHRITDQMRSRGKQNVRYENYRDLEAEGEVAGLLFRYLDRWDDELDIFFSPKDDEGLYEFLQYGINELMDHCEVRVTDAFRRLKIRRKASFDIKVSMETDLLDLKLTSEDLSGEELMEIFRSYSQKKSFIRLKNGDFFRIEENETLKELSEMMDALHISLKEFVSGKMHVPAYRALYLEKMLEQTQDIYADRDRRFKKLVKEFKTVRDADFEFPESLKPVLRGYQREGYRWLRTLSNYRFGGILADEMGLGKTLQAIAVLLAEKTENADAGTSIVVCPASLVYNWEEELHRFARELDVSVVSGTRKEREEIIRKSGSADVMVTSYDLLKRDIHLYEDRDFVYAILDEAQFIKNRGTAAARTVKLLNSRIRFALTGTPIENRLAELWSIFDFLMPGLLYDYSQFQKEFELPVLKKNDQDAADRLRRMTGPFILRRLKKDVLKDLPEKLEEIRYAVMDEKQRRLYDAQVLRMSREMKEKSEDEFRRSRIQILAELMKIRQICCDPSLLFENYDGGSAKREACMELIRSAADGGHKVLIFSQFTTMLCLIGEDLKNAGIDYYMITGATPKEQRVRLVNQFNEDATPVFLISLKAGGTGLNLTGADIVIHYDPWWNLAVQNQATDRAHRIGQKNVVTVYRLIAKGTIEEKIVLLQDQKKHLADEILNSEAIADTTLCKEDLLALLES